MDDSSKAAANAQFKVNRDQLEKLIEHYRQRKYVEDLEYMTDELNGSAGLLESLNV